MLEDSIDHKRQLAARLAWADRAEEFIRKLVSYYKETELYHEACELLNQLEKQGDDGLFNPALRDALLEKDKEKDNG